MNSLLTLLTPVPEPRPSPAAPGERIQRPTSEFPVLHLEPSIPAADWEVVVDGMVAQPLTWPVSAVQSMVAESRSWDLHCVWGWSKFGCCWEGVPAGRLIDAARPLPGAQFVLAIAAGDGYASCLNLHRARRSLLAWRLDGTELSADHGGPLRLVPPPSKWGYKGVKWISRLTLISDFSPGFWEDAVGDPQGDIPNDVIVRTSAARRRGRTN
ncbi:MAG: molybdopterin-dependent oxidoreductase [Actinomycetota bacterium]